MVSYLLLSLSLLLLSAVVAAAARDVEVVTPSGPLLGYVETVHGRDLNIFLGVPFAQPPVGDRRFRRPEPLLSPWTERRNATTLPSTCWQNVDEQFDRFPGVDMWNPNTPMSEDCLYLNVWAPTSAAPEGRLAVLLWIYGGGLSSGTSTLDIYDGRQLAVYGNVLVVSVQYRVGPLGFLSAGPSAPGNMGLLDQYVAIAWLRDNVAAFGGDPERMTLFGESAGALSTSAHLFSPLSAPLISRAIMQSGSLLASWAIDPADRAHDKARQLGELLGCRRDIDVVADCLRDVPADRLTAAQWQVDDDSYLATPFVATIDGHFLPDTPDALVANGRFKNTSILLGSTANEGTYFLAYMFPDLFPIDTNRPLTRAEYTSSVRSIFAPRHGHVAATVVDFEYREPYEFQHAVDYREQLEQLVGDSNIVCPVNKLAEAYAEGAAGAGAGGKVYAYLFEHISSQNPWPRWMGSMHGYEIDHVFGHPRNSSRGYSREETQLSERMMTYWSNFAKTGDPNKGGDAPDGGSLWLWPEYSVSNKQYILLSTDESTTRHGLRTRQCAFWQTLVPQIQNGEPCSSAAPRGTRLALRLLLVALAFSTYCGGSAAT